MSVVSIPLTEAAASRTSPFSYQWNLNGSAITGGTSASYSIAAVQPANAGNYTVTVSNVTGIITSQPGNINGHCAANNYDPAGRPVRH